MWYARLSVVASQNNTIFPRPLPTWPRSSVGESIGLVNRRSQIQVPVVVIKKIILKKFLLQVMSDLEKSSIKKFLFNMALSSKEQELSRFAVLRNQFSLPILSSDIC